MKKVILSILLVILIESMGFASIPDFKNSPDGFRGLKWGDSVSALGVNAELIRNEPKIETVQYSKKGEVLSLGGADLSQVVYFFWKDKFISVMLICKSPSDFHPLKEVAIERFGNPVKPNRYIEKYGWLDDNAMINLSKNPPSMAITSVSLLLQQIQENKEKAKSGAATGF